MVFLPSKWSTVNNSSLWDWEGEETGPRTKMCNMHREATGKGVGREGKRQVIDKAEVWNCTGSQKEMSLPQNSKGDFGDCFITEDAV